jgi:hypothetical protein
MLSDSETRSTKNEIYFFEGLCRFSIENRMKKESSYQNQYNRAPDMSIKSISKYISKLKYYRKHPAEEAKTTTGRAPGLRPAIRHCKSKQVVGPVVF